MAHASGVVSGVAYSAPAAVVAGPVAVSNQYHAQDALGQYSYGYSGGPSSKAKTADGITRGGYSYIDSYGIVQSASYVSDPVNGFRVAATNLPFTYPPPSLTPPRSLLPKSRMLLRTRRLPVLQLRSRTCLK
jgi:hypothetical protein